MADRPASILDRPVSIALKRRIAPAFGRARGVVPIEERADALVVAAATPLGDATRANLGRAVGKAIDVVIAPADEVARVQDLLWGPVAAPGAAEITRGEDASAIRFLDDLLERAVAEGASDIHIEPAEDHIRVRLRIDGRLIEDDRYAKRLQRLLGGRVKALSDLRHDDPRIAQDGRFRAEIHGRRFDVRVSILPMVFGEGVALRLLDRSSLRLDPATLGFPPAMLDAWRSLGDLGHGLVLVTGPTGSGKTTTLDATLLEIARRHPERNVMTIEDPVEYVLDGVNQCEVNPAVDFTFARALERFLRHDPDVVLVGEVRDVETAGIAVRAAMTGHLVYATVHTNDAASAPGRLMEMGVDGFLLSDTLRAVLAQRLVPVVCAACAEPVRVGDDAERVAAEWLGLEADETIRRGRGCGRCRGTGLRGRTGIFELLRVDDDVRDAVRARAGAAMIASMARYAPLAHDGLVKVRAGVTTPEGVRAAVWTG